MKISTLILGIGFSLIGSMATHSFAQSSVDSGCSWTVIAVNNFSYGATVASACQLNGTTLAYRSQTWSQYSPPSCSITWVAPNHTSSGACASAKIMKTVAPVCYTGSSMIVQTGPNGYMNPVFNANHFCGQGCPYSVQPLDQHSYPRLKYTCL
ncbi:hypothetical protein [Cellvibrio japonicus]|uniref:Lipoprotein n=1 Tax=Cellvibrio japonicus (strain Ueda107) TaxID=498211 RepID=B3PGG4_CELJU|nr:hypothetical protein [Cellvibrio japonicus]ACE85144.1 hypothetical protein CJA_0219 [Cellvibrio japonicus Ueda107]QEI10954.1 hypothetical protein FY117_01060 [Cellvibrio japonicus]QEI14530.1 hypothetical protein FY116_01060 [Cellvibrio japonicus]QEI18108.1 hypothetical protein FY115_01060 [Cellvibrio japonicus]